MEDQLASQLLTEYQPHSRKSTYRLIVQAQESGFQISWSVINVPYQYRQVELRLVAANDSQVINMREQSSVTFDAREEPYQFDLLVSKDFPMQLEAGWNMISFPGQPLATDPVTLKGDSQTAMLPIFGWHSSGFSYQAVEELKVGEGYWMLTLNQQGEGLVVPLEPVESYSIELKWGWNLIGSVSKVYDFSDPIDEPDNSIVNGTLYGWRAKGFSYQASSRIEPGKGYWVLAQQDCQLTVGGEIGVPAAPKVVAEPATIIAINLSAGEWQQDLEIGLDRSARNSFESMDRPIPPSGPIEMEHQSYLIGNPYRLSRDVRPVSEEEISWQMRVSSPDPVDLTIDSQQIPRGQELVIIDGQVETVLTAGGMMELDSGDRQLTVSLRPLPKVTQVRQNYPNPFNPETWIPYQLNQASEVSLSVYSDNGKLVRQIDLGLKPAGNYQRTERAIYWDGRNANGESVSSGVYFYRLQAGNFSQTRKMVILK